MKIDRRSFLSFVIGGAAGTALTPLPWKLTDDLSIWTQNWPWTPVPEDGAASYVHSVCTLCPGGCGISVRKIDDRAVKIEGMKGHPVNDGGVCILGLSGLQLLYGPTRVKTPLKRVGERGEGRWKKISYDEAISEVSEKLGKLRADGQPQGLACISGSDQGTVPQIFRRFLTAYGSPNFMTIPSFQDSYSVTLKLMQGVEASAGFDIENADFVLSFGSGIIEGWGSPVRMFKANSAWEDKKGTLVQIEPRLSNTAAKSDEWLPVKPGTEGDLALGLAHVIISQGLYNKDFVENHTFGFEDQADEEGKSCTGLKKFVLDNYSPDKVAKTTGLDADAIVSLGKRFAGASNPVAVCGRGQGNTPGSLQEFMAVHTLNALVGNINKKGGVWAIPETDCAAWPEARTDDVAGKGLATPRIDEAGTERYPYAKSLLNRFAEAVGTGEQSPVQALLVSGANPCYTLPDTKAVKAAFKKIPFVVSFSSFMDETARQADLILPNHTCLEGYEDVPSPAGLQKSVIGLSAPAVSPQFDTRYSGDVILRVAKELKGSVAGAFPWDDYETCLKEAMGDKWDALTENGFVSADVTPADWGEAFAGTPSKKFEFVAAGYKQTAIEGDEKAYPLVLVPYDSIRLANGSIGNPPFATKTVENTVLKGNDVLVEINPETARSRFLFLNDGDYAVLSTPKGKAKVRVHLFDGIMPGIIAMPRGLGHTAYDEYLAGKGVNFNELIGPVEDPGSGLDAAYGIRAKLTNVPI